MSRQTMGGLRAERAKAMQRSGSALRPEYAPERQARTLFVGNLDKRVTEYQLLTIFTPLGNVVRCNYLWHLTGEQRGLPRGYAFIEYETKEQAERAREATDGKIVLGRPMVVRFAEPKDWDDIEAGAHQSKMAKAETSSTSLSVKLSAEEKIRAIERKLARMQQEQQQKSAGASAFSSSSPLSSLSSTSAPTGSTPAAAAAAPRQGQKRPHESEEKEPEKGKDKTSEGGEKAADGTEDERRKRRKCDSETSTEESRKECVS